MSKKCKTKKCPKKEHGGTVRTCTRRCNPFLGDTTVLANQLYKNTTAAELYSRQLEQGTIYLHLTDDCFIVSNLLFVWVTQDDSASACEQIDCELQVLPNCNMPANLHEAKRWQLLDRFVTWQSLDTACEVGNQLHHLSARHKCGKMIWQRIKSVGMEITVTSRFHLRVAY